MTDALSGVTTYDLDAVGNILSVENALGQKKTYQYNEIDQIIQEIDALGMVTEFSFEDDPELASIAQYTQLAAEEQTPEERVREATLPI